jgi:triosephosphate isomerase
MAGNWKMHLTHLEAIQHVQKLSYALDEKDYKEVDVAVCPPFTALRSVQTVLDADRIPIALGAQNCHWEPQGAYTGEISAPMLAKLNVTYVIVGHSERRELFGETDEMVAKKVRAVLGAGMDPILCVGETLEENEAGQCDEKVTRQIEAALRGLKTDDLRRCVVAYEPIWAIGTGKTATPEDANATIATIRVKLGELAADISGEMRILYGGSVKPGNVAALMAMPEIDGGLVGGACLDPDDYARLVKYWRS